MRALMRMAVVLAGMAWGVPLLAATQCQVVSAARPMRAFGLAELVGPVEVRCWGGTPFTLVEGQLDVTLDSLVGNPVENGLLAGIVLERETDTGWQTVPNVRARPWQPNMVLLDQIQVPFGANGQLVLRVKGLRAESAREVVAMLNFTGTPALPVRFAAVVAGRSNGVAVGASSTTAIPRIVDVPAEPDFAQMLATQAPLAAARVTETDWTMFSTGEGGAPGTRVVVWWDATPPGTVVYVPEAVAGINAVQPTSGGGFGQAPAAGIYGTQGGQTLLLARVHGADEQGAGGAPVFVPQTGLNVLNAIGRAGQGEDGHYAVYEVLSTNPDALESAQIPGWVVMTEPCCVERPLVRARVMLGPVSDVRGAIEGVPAPRFAPHTAIADCMVLGDCGAAWFPRLRALPDSPTTFTAPSGGRHQIGYVLVHNAGGDLLAWRAAVQYTDGADWIRVHPESGVGSATIRYDVLPETLAPGEYRAQLVVTGMAGAGQAVIEVVLTVTEPLPPALPAPVVRDVVKAGNRLPGPVSPGSLALVLGQHFGEGTTVRVGGLDAVVLLVEDDEILIEVPRLLDPRLGRAPVEVFRGGRRSVPWGVELAAIAPGVPFALNEDDGERNSEEFPVDTGRALWLFVTGLEMSEEPAVIRIHDRDLGEVAPRNGEEEPSGARVYRVTVPEDLPAMSTAVLVCGRAEADAPLVCAQPHDIVLRRP